MIIAAPIVTGENPLTAGNVVYREQGLDAWAIWFTTYGRVHITHPKGVTVSGPGEAVLIAPRVRQEYGPRKPCVHWDCIWAVFHPRPYWDGWMKWPELAPGTMRLRPAQAGLVRTALRRMHQAATGPARCRHDLALCHLEEALLLCQESNPLSRQKAVDPRVQKVLDCLRRDYRTDWAPETLAAVAGLSVPHLARLFREQVGLTPRAYAERNRFERAVELLRYSGLRINEIATELGFDDPLYFSARFKKQFGIGPREYRQAGE